MHLPEGDAHLRYEDRYGYLRPVNRETVYKYLNCGDLKQDFARVRCPDCGHEYLLAFSCKGRYFCTSCHTKRAVAFAEWLHTTILLPVPHRQIVLTIPKMLRVIRAILMHLALWDVPRARPPPESASGTVDFEYFPCED